MTTKWTNEQLEAIVTRKCNLLVAAAAGSGKTAVLVERIIRIVTDEENPVDVDRLLVVTFTKAAAAEMRERIAAAITKELESNPNSKNLQKQLTLLSRANITTMHSFCLDVIKNNFHVIDLDPSFRISDETEGILLKNEIIDELFEDLYDENDEEFLNLVEAFSNSKSDDNLKDIIKDLYRFSMSGPWPEKWLKEKSEEFNLEEGFDGSIWVNILKRELLVETESYINLYNRALEIIKETDGLEPYIPQFTDELSNLINLRDSLNGNIKNIENAICNLQFARLKTVKKSSVSDEGAQEFVKRIRDDCKKKMCAIVKDPVFNNIGESLDTVRKCYPYMKKLSEITLEFGKRFSDRKKERNMLDFNDLEHFCLKILSGDTIGEPSQIALNFREFFDEVLVDEYQDSNNVQEAIINLVSRKNTDNPNVFMVGDVKQSIYRFRQAKPELFLEKYNTYSKVPGEKTRVIQLYKNFRSREEVINGVNFIFKKLMSETVGELEYTDSEALNLGANFPEIEEGLVAGGKIEVNILDKSNNVIEAKETEDDEEEEDIEWINLEARIVCRRIKELMSESNNFRVLDKETGEYRKLKYKDIVILLRATKNWAEAFVDEFGVEGIPAYADTGSGYFESIEVRTIMALLKIIDNPMQDVPMIAVLRSPIFGFKAEDFTDIRIINKDKYFYENILDIAKGEVNIREELIEKCRSFNERLNIWRDKSVYMPIDEFIWHLYMDTAYFAYVGAMPNGMLRQANLKVLFQRARVYEETSFKGLFNFINFINKLRKSSGDMESAKILGENEDVVRIMSIHKSKGLEFPVVFLSGAGKNFNLMDMNKSILYHDDLGFGPNYVDLEKRLKYSTLPKEAIKKKFKLETLSEEMRILYVAFTRAKEKLIVTGAVNDIEKTAKKWVKSASIEKERIVPSEVSSGKSYIDWIGMALCQHIDGEPIREKVDGDKNIVSDDLSTWDVKVWNKNDFSVEKNLEPVGENEDKELFITLTEGAVDKEVERRLGFKYKFEALTTMKSNLSVSELKRAGYESLEADYDGEVLFKDKPVIKPRFLQETKGLSGAERGTAVHFIMQKIDYDRVSTINEIKGQIKEMYDSELITTEEYEAINPFKIKAFFDSNIGKRVLNAYNSGKMVRREFPFFLELDVSEVKEELKGTNFEETVRIQGIIDLFFEEDGKIILVDYKTDYIEADAEKEMKDKYSIQIKYYKNALERITKKEVSESILFLFFKESEVIM